MPAVSSRLLTRLRGETAFTLTEMLVVLAIIGLLVGSFSALLSTTIRHSTEIQEQDVTQTELRAAIDRLAAEVRQAYSGDGATAPIEVATGTALQFLSPDRAQPFHLRRIAYRVGSGRLERAMATSSDTDGAPWIFPALGAYGLVVDSITNASPFTYLDAANAPTTVAANVRTVRISFTVATKASPGRQYTYSTSVSLRSAP
ncbi:prepilin-type N-terminal cleavage/methylation domain [Gaiella occulta]|uniref:Prepilin-type N-terminal cleavage/methylation domain n=1 Tax=Gaiella occulta TaxID=1002870 RepID=A0A7M2YV12_9ACTN|nr:prepilin-type N-terminal cleavage/methylation domain [Gaiella occulta]